MDLGCLCRINVYCSVPELVVEPFKRESFMKIIVADLFNVTRNMKRFSWPGIKAYVKMNFQIFVCGSARIYRNFLNVCFVLFSRKFEKWIQVLKSRQVFTGYYFLFL